MRRHGEIRAHSMKPFYQDDAVTLYHGDCREILPQIGLADHVIMDPPYSEHVHAKEWVAHALTDRAKRRNTPEGIGFEALSEDVRELVSESVARLVRRWVLVFCDVESSHHWHTSLAASG